MVDTYQDEAKRIRNEAALARLKAVEDRNTAASAAAMGRRRVDMPGGGYAVVNAGAQGLSPDELDAIRADPRYAQRSQGSPINYKIGDGPEQTFQPLSHSQTFDLAPMREQQSYDLATNRAKDETRFATDEATRLDQGSTAGGLNRAKASGVEQSTKVMGNRDAREGQTFDVALPAAKAQAEAAAARAALESKLTKDIAAPAAGPSGMGGMFDAAASNAGFGSPSSANLSAMDRLRMLKDPTYDPQKARRDEASADEAAARKKFDPTREVAMRLIESQNPQARTLGTRMLAQDPSLSGFATPEELSGALRPMDATRNTSILQLPSVAGPIKRGLDDFVSTAEYDPDGAAERLKATIANVQKAVADSGGNPEEASAEILNQIDSMVPRTSTAGQLARELLGFGGLLMESGYGTNKARKAIGLDK